MTVVELYPDRLPLEPITSSSCLKEWFRCSEAYYSILRAEGHAIEQAKANPTSLKARDNVVFARVAGYFLIELFNRREVLGETPCEALLLPLSHEPTESGYETVFSTGKFLCNLIHLCACARSLFASLSFSVSQQSCHHPRSPLNPPPISSLNSPPISSFDPPPPLSTRRRV